MGNRCETFWASIKAKSVIERRQDGQGARTPADLEQKYDIEGVANNATNAKATADKSLEIVSQMSETTDGLALKVAGLTEDLNGAFAQIELKVGRDENDQIISMINASANVITLNSNRLIINSDNFNLTADGVVTAKDINITGGSLELPLENGMYVRAGGFWSGLCVDSSDYSAKSGKRVQILPYGITYEANGVGFPLIQFGGTTNTLAGDWCVGGTFKIGSTSLTEANLKKLLALI